FEQLYTAAEMRAVEERYPDYPSSVPELMERAGAAVAREAMLAFPDARRFGCVCGGGSNGGDGRVAARVLREAGLVAEETEDVDGYDVLVDALFGTGFHGAPRPDAASLSERVNAPGVLIVGGQPGMTGAACLSARAALRADAGYVTLAVPAESLPIVETMVLEPVKIGWRDADAVEEISRAAERAGAVAIGPGLGRSDERRALVRELLRRLDVPAVVDADALFELDPVERDAPTVLTPHAGELARLLDTDSGWVDAHRLEAAQRAADRFDAVVLLKGPDTIVAEPGKGVIVSDLGPPSL